MSVSYDETVNALRAEMRHHEPIVLIYDARGNGGVKRVQRSREITRTG